MGQALYRKYRSRSLKEIVGQEHITDTLRKAIDSGRISHAYLFTGPRGVGKTSIARILAHELNGVPYDGETNYLDIIEIDAASNGGVDEVRDLRDKVYVAPSAGKYKVYIIDEVHMMTTSAFNALLKTLEEPPAHTIFILATTESHKLPATIVSRTQRFTFKPVPRPQVTAHLRSIADKEKIDISDEALELIAEHGEGSFRDSISMLDQAGSSQAKVTKQDIEHLLGIPPASAIDSIVEALSTHDGKAIAARLGELRSNGFQASRLAKQLGNSLRRQLVDGKLQLAEQQTFTLLRRLIDVPASHDPDQLLEVVLLEAALAQTTDSVAKVHAEPARVQAPQPAAVQVKARDHTPKPPVQKATKEVVADNEAITATTTAVSDGATWQSMLDALKKEYNTLYGIIRMAQPEFLPGKIKLAFGYAFHQKRASDAKNKQIISSILHDLTGNNFAIECHFDKTATPPAPVSASTPKPMASSPALNAISSVFGGGEVLEP